MAVGVSRLAARFGSVSVCSLVIAEAIGRLMQMAVHVRRRIATMTHAETTVHRRGRERLNRKAQRQNDNEDELAPVRHGFGT